MSLTSHLADPGSQIGQFIKQHFAQTLRLTKATNQELKMVPTLRPKEAAPGYPYSPIGAAVDYRIRYAFDLTPFQELVAFHGARLLARQAYYPPQLLADFFYRLDATLDKIQPRGRLLDKEAERILDRYCIVLSYFEQVFRSNAYLQGPLLVPKTKRTVEELLAIPQDSWIDDVAAIFSLFYERCHTLLTKPHILNPTFSGSVDIGGADADMIVDGCLIDIKTSIYPTIKADHIHQLAGYLLLDYDDHLHIQSLGIYMARQGLLFTWPVTAFVTALTEDSSVSVASLRQAFRTLLKKRTR